ncbi:MAG: multiheme c-type cytochrome [Thermoanaerobaculia bacterium]|nr:multiheme c-type cytochrome [Thermoanaerobaculia bacterium]
MRRRNRRKSSSSPRDRSLEGWRSRLAAGVAAGLLFSGLSGLWIYLAPFSLASQLLVLLHAGIGLLLVLPMAWYGTQHLATWWRQKITATMLVGYLVLTGVIVALVSGLVLTWQSLFGSRLGELWDLIHLIVGLAVLGLVASHLTLAFFRRRLAARKDEELATAMGGFLRGVGIPLVLVLGGAVLAGAFWPRPDYRFDPPEGYSLLEYAEKHEEYRGNPFAPTYARTDDGRMVAPELLAGSESCGTAGCHEEILDEWEPSAHRFSAMNAPFQAVQRNFASDRNPAETRYCAGCHDPISLFAGAKDMSSQSLSAPGVEEGISCAGCHSISRVDQRGNADYVVTPPRKYLGEGSRGLAGKASDFLIRAYPRQHLADYDRNLLRTPEFCGACHKQFIPEALNRFGQVEGQNQYDEWKNGHWHSDDPTEDLSCRDCHMRLVPESSDPGRGEAGDRRRTEDDGAHRHHGFIATNNFMPEVLDLPHWEEQVRLTNEWMRGETVLPEIADVWPEGPVAGLELLAPAQAAPGEEVEVRIVVTNRKAGHNFVTGPLDFVRAWIHLQLVDSEGTVLAEFGTVDPETRRIEDLPGEEHAIGNPRDEGTLVLESLPVDEHGEVLHRHELWKKAGGKGKRVIFAGYSDSHRYRLRIPEAVESELSIRAALNYRRYRQEFLDLVVPDLEETTGVFQPTITQARASTTIAVVSGDSSALRLGG